MRIVSGCCWSVSPPWLSWLCSSLTWPASACPMVSWAIGSSTRCAPTEKIGGGDARPYASGLERCAAVEAILVHDPRHCHRALGRRAAGPRRPGHDGDHDPVHLYDGSAVGVADAGLGLG